MDSLTETDFANHRQIAMLETHSSPKLKPNLKSKTDNNKPCIDVMFLIANNTSLTLDYKEFNEQAMAYLTHNVSRNPLDLQSHMQRIYLYMADFDGDKTYCAVLDLFIALENRGQPLRKRILQETRHFLKLQQYDALTRKIECGLYAHEAMPLAKTSVLTKSYIGHRKIVERITKELPVSPENDPIIEAGQYLEYGQIEEARTLLEGAVLEQPWRKDLQNDLLDIYRVTLDGKACDAMYERLADSFIPDHHAWMQTAEQILHNADTV